MKHLKLLVILLICFISAFSASKKEERKYNEVYRPQFHYTPELNKMDRPLSVWVNDTTYFLYYQQNPYNLLDGYINWGLATSSDLLSWEPKGLVIKQPENLSDSMYQVPLTGTVLSKNKGAIALVSRWDDGLYFTKSDDGIRWSEEIKTSGTEMLKKFENCVFWYEPDQKWVMFAFDRETTTMYILNSGDGINWEKTFNFNYNFGYPQFIELNVDRKPDEKLWMLATEKGTYMLGEFNGKSFNPKSSVKRMNYGRNISSSCLFNDPLSGQVINISGMNGEQLADLPSNGQFTFPTVCSLKEFDYGIELVQKPIDAISKLHGKSYSWENKKIYPGLKNNLLKGIKSSELHLKAVIDVMSSDLFGFRIRSGRTTQGTEFSFDLKNEVVNLLGTQMAYESKNGKIEIEMLIDRSTIEVFINEGRYVISYPFEPSPEAKGYELYTVGGEIMVDKMEVYELNSIWSED